VVFFYVLDVIIIESYLINGFIGMIEAPLMAGWPWREVVLVER